MKHGLLYQRFLRSRYLCRRVPVSAISEGDGKYVIDADSCISCAPAPALCLLVRSKRANLFFALARTKSRRGFWPAAFYCGPGCSKSRGKTAGFMCRTGVHSPYFCFRERFYGTFRRNFVYGTKALLYRKSSLRNARATPLSGFCRPRRAERGGRFAAAVSWRGPARIRPPGGMPVGGWMPRAPICWVAGGGGAAGMRPYPPAEPGSNELEADGGYHLVAANPPYFTG